MSEPTLLDSAPGNHRVLFFVFFVLGHVLGLVAGFELAPEQVEVEVEVQPEMYRGHRSCLKLCGTRGVHYYDSSYAKCVCNRRMP